MAINAGTGGETGCSQRAADSLSLLAPAPVRGSKSLTAGSRPVGRAPPSARDPLVAHLLYFPSLLFTDESSAPPAASKRHHKCGVFPACLRRRLQLQKRTNPRR